jgi:hypothetical protein
MPSQKKVTWNEFRALHKGVSVNKLSQHWTDYKVGQYKLPDVKSVTEEVAEEKANKMEAAVVAIREAPQVPEEGDLIREFQSLTNRVTRFGKSMPEEKLDEIKARINELAILTAPTNYTCTQTDGWKLWTGPTQACVLANESKRVAFACTRGWWNATWQGAKYVSYETVVTEDTLNAIAKGYITRRAFVKRPPLEGVEIMLPRTARDTMLRGN